MVYVPSIITCTGLPVHMSPVHNTYTLVYIYIHTRARAQPIRGTCFHIMFMDACAGLNIISIRAPAHTLLFSSLRTITHTHTHTDSNSRVNTRLVNHGLDHVVVACAGLKSSYNSCTKESAFPNSCTPSSDLNQSRNLRV